MDLEERSTGEEQALAIQYKRLLLLSTKLS
jgi:hypothetical protein